MSPEAMSEQETLLNMLQKVEPRTLKEMRSDRTSGQRRKIWEISVGRCCKRQRKIGQTRIWFWEKRNRCWPLRASGIVKKLKPLSKQHGSKALVMAKAVDSVRPDSQALTDKLGNLQTGLLAKK